MSFSPLSFFLSLAITGPAFGSLVVASDRHYPIFSDSRGSLYWMDESGSMTAHSNDQDPDICSRPRSSEIDIREQQSFPTQKSIRPLPGADKYSEADFQLALSIAPRPEPLKYDRAWIGNCGVSSGKNMIIVSPLDAGLPFDAIPVSSHSGEEVSACLKISRDGEVTDFNFARPGGQASPAVAQKIEQIARKCWKFNNRTDQAGWIQVGLDRREQAISL